MKRITLLIWILVFIAACNSDNKTTIESTPKKEQGGDSFFDYYTREVAMPFSIGTTENSSVDLQILEEDAISTVFFGFSKTNKKPPIGLKVFTVGMNKHNTFVASHRISLHQYGKVEISPIHLEIEEWLNKQKLAFRDKQGRVWKLISMPQPTHTEFLSGVGLMGPGQIKAFYEEDQPYIELHIKDELGQKEIWQYQPSDL